MEKTPTPNSQQSPPDESTKQPSEKEEQIHRTGGSTRGAVFAVILIASLLGGGLIGYTLSYATFNNKIADLQTQLKNLPPTNATYVSYPSSTFVLGDNISLSALYQQVKSSVVIIQGLVPQYNFFGFLAGYGTQQGSGFITLVGNQPVVVTNNHVMEGATNVTVTFANGDSYPATEAGSDPLADLAVLTINAVPTDLKPLNLISSSTLQVGDPVVAVGSPYGLSGTLTTGVVSALGRTITETDGSGPQSTSINIPDVIQTSTAINPGNSGGPLINYRGDVVGITTAAVSNSESLGFAIPSETILREINSLLTTGSYDNHPTINAAGIDMDFRIAQAMGVNITYGWLVESVSVQNGLKAGSTQAVVGASRVIIGGDIIIGINGAKITNTDELLSYLEQHTLPGQSVDFSVIRDRQIQSVAVNIGKLSF